jgi:hypothetical protein
MLVLDVPQINTIVKNEKHEFVLNNEHVKNCLIFENQPRKNKMLNTNRLDINKVLPLIDKLSLDYSSKSPLFSEIKVTTIINAFSKITSNLLLFNPDKIGLELTNSGTLYFFLAKNDVKIHFETFFKHNIEGQPFECVVNAFELRKPILSLNGSFSKVMNELKSVLPSSENNYLNFIKNSSSYGISSRIITESWL